MNNIKHIRKKLGLSQHSVAQAANTTAATIMKLEKGDMALTYAWMKRLAPALKCRPQDLIADSPSRAIPIVARVGAGAVVYPIDDHSLGGGMEEVEAPEFIPEPHKIVGLLVEGDSMHPAYRHGDRIYYRRTVDFDRDACMWTDCVVELEDGRVYVKVIAPSKTPGCFTLTSHNASPIEDVRIKWAAPVEWVQRVQLK